MELKKIKKGEYNILKSASLADIIRFKQDHDDIEINIMYEYMEYLKRESALIREIEIFRRGMWQGLRVYTAMPFISLGVSFFFHAKLYQLLGAMYDRSKILLLFFLLNAVMAAAWNIYDFIRLLIRHTPANLEEDSVETLYTLQELIPKLFKIQKEGEKGSDYETTIDDVQKTLQKHTGSVYDIRTLGKALQALECQKRRKKQGFVYGLEEFD